MSAEEADTAGAEHYSSTTSHRNEGIDFVRGSLIILMILHHSAVFSQGDYVVTFLRDYLFTAASGGFVFMAGVSVRKYAFRAFCANRLKGSKYLIFRGLQLILLFSAAVVVGHLFAVLPPPQASIHEYIIRVFLVSYPEGVPYEVLLGIGYLFLVSPLILCLLPHRTLSVVIVLLALSAATASGLRFGQNAWIVLCGSWGMILTHISLKRFDAQNRSELVRLPWIWSLGAFFIAASAYGAMGAPKENIIIYVSYITFVLLMIYHMFMMSPLSWRSARVTKCICRAGRMSLYWYIFHVPVVVVLNNNISWGGGVVSFVVGFLMVLGVTAALISMIGVFSRRLAAFQYM